MTGTLSDLIASHEPGHVLPRAFYTAPEIYEHDIARVWMRNWLWAGHVSQIPEPGRYFLFDFGPESVIVVRDRDGGIRAHLNVCRHRGSRLCTEPEGTARVFVCPYHAWTYELSGQLRGSQHMGEGFDPSKWGLLPVQVAVFDGLIFVCADDATPSLEPVTRALAPLTAAFGLEDLKIAHRASYPVPANWKLAVENYLECYHCGPAHQDYARSHSLKSPQDMAALLGPMQHRAAEAGIATEELSLVGADAPDPRLSAYCRRYPLYPGYGTGSRTGAPLAPLLGAVTDHDGGATDLGLGPLNWFLIYADHLVGYRFLPRGPQLTDIEVVWMVRGDAVEGRDYDRAALTWLWHVTSQDDERIIRNNQAGVNSQRYRPGPLSTMEGAIGDFHGFYFDMIAPAPDKRGDRP